MGEHGKESQRGMHCCDDKNPNEDRMALEKQIVVKDDTEKKKEEVTDVTSQESEKPIMFEEKEINDQEKEIEAEKEKEGR